MSYSFQKWESGYAILNLAESGERKNWYRVQKKSLPKGRIGTNDWLELHGHSG